MSNWKTKQFYCDKCKKWYDAHHMSHQDPRAKGQGCTAGGGLKLLNPETGQDYCTACKQFDTAENTVFYCNCGQVLKASYSDSTTVVQASHGILVTNGQQAYVVSRTDIAAAQQRRFRNVGAR